MKKPVDWLNYQHLLYFWMVGRTGSITEAARKLHLSSPTVSAQIRKFERATGCRLLRPLGRGIELTDAGGVVMGYAEQIFGLGAELADVLTGQLPGGKRRLRIGIVDAVPKLVVHRLLRPVLQSNPPVQLECSEGEIGVLTDLLTSHHLDVLISDSEVLPHSGTRVQNHLLARSATSFFAAPTLVAPSDGTDLYQLLRTRPLLLPATGSSLRRQLDQFFDAEEIYPAIAHQFSDTALMKVFGQAAAGIFPGPSVVESTICQQYAVQSLGKVDQVQESFFAITISRQIDHPAVTMLVQMPPVEWTQ
jgi:LysR family transcriptional activator of nhaA